MNQTDFYNAKLNYETDSWDLSEALNNKENVVVIDARSPEAYSICLLYTSPSPRDLSTSRMPSSA